MVYRLDRSGIVKVADFGLAEDMYASNYYRQGKSSDDVETKVPIRWMPLESIEEGLFNEKSDVVSLFRITVRITEPPTCSQDHQYNLLQFFRIF